MNHDCLFCKLINQEIPANIVYEDEQVLAFRDIDPKAPEHLLIIPKQHISTLNDADETHAKLLGQLMLTASNLAKQTELASDGYRVVMNCNEAGGQTVFHIHLHLLAGRNFSWPPG